MSMDLLIATSNSGKLREYQTLLTGLPLRLLSLKDVGLDTLDVQEEATTLLENASFKAQTYAQASGIISLADDTGLFVDALDGRPGVYPARYGGPGLTPQQRRQKLLQELSGVPEAQRTARFICIIAVLNPQQSSLQTVEGICAGRIAMQEEEAGEGFGYDPVFIPEGFEVTWGRVPLEAKNAISHRGKAARLVVPVLEQMVNN
jgi:XTP/dITP diphosphohydrolase